MIAIGKINQKSLAEKTADAILDLIQCHNYGVGTKLPNEHELAEQLEVGRNTVRAAIRLLTERNILEVRRGSGTYISARMGVSEDPLGLSLNYDKEKMTADLLLIRLLIEPKMAALAAQNASAREKRQIMLLCEEMEILHAESSPYLFKDLEFHALIASASRNSVVHNMIPSIHQAILLQNNIPKKLLGIKTLRAHRQIAEAIRDGRGSDAYDAMTKHIVQNSERIEG